MTGPSGVHVGDNTVIVRDGALLFVIAAGGEAAAMALVPTPIWPYLNMEQEFYFVKPAER